MRLLHTTELRFEEFLDDKIPDYAILSHKWGNDEVSYEDFITGNNKDSAGYAKILECCRFAATDMTNYRNGRLFRGRFNWVWIDTCCIDKSSSAELSEAINSMFRWYASCVVCYAYLSDVTSNDQMIRAFKNSHWFGRGWTLQELLAPSRVVFLSREWTRIGTRDTLAPHISTAAGILQSHVTNFCNSSPLSVKAAEKFSWIATRTTSRLEDQAYCLMGLFDINMPLLYGEGNKAFYRLQLEILRSSNDESIFVWDVPVGWPWARVSPHLSGLLAKSTTDFGAFLYHRHAQKYRKLHETVPISRPPYTITNQGLELRVPKRLAILSEFFLPLNYRSFKDGVVRGVYTILLQKVKTREAEEWRRSFSKSLSETLPKLPAVEYERGPSVGLFIAPESWLWSREELDETETRIIYVSL